MIIIIIIIIINDSEQELRKEEETWYEMMMERTKTMRKNVNMEVKIRRTFIEKLAQKTPRQKNLIQKCGDGYRKEKKSLKRS